MSFLYDLLGPSYRSVFSRPMFRSLSGRSLAGIAAILVSCVIAVMTLSPTALAEGIDPPLID